jgi:transcriptional regulator of acetoin/glycerol metabolism
MNDIETARANIKQRVAEYIEAHPETTYSSMAKALGVSRWRIQTVASGMGLNRKTGPKPKRPSNGLEA